MVTVVSITLCEDTDASQDLLLSGGHRHKDTEHGEGGSSLETRRSSKQLLMNMIGSVCGAC